MVEPLKKRYTITDKVIEHIFEGEVNDGNLTGFHSEAVKSIEKKNVRLKDGWAPGQKEARQASKPYYATVEVLIKGKWYGPKASSFFPMPGAGSKWTKDYIILKLEQGMTSHSDSTRSSRKAWEDQPRAIKKVNNVHSLKTVRADGVRCNITYNDGKPATIYPLVAGFGG